MIIYNFSDSFKFLLWPINLPVKERKISLPISATIS